MEDGGQERPARFVALATAGAIAYSVFLPLFVLTRTYIEPVDPHRPLAFAALATLCCLPPQVWLVVSAARGTHRRAQRWVLCAAAVLHLGTLAVVGADWIGEIECLAGLVLIVLRPRWSLPLFAAMVAATAPVSILFGHQEWAVYFTMGMVIIGPAQAAPVQLLAKVRELEAARAALAEEAIVLERLRITAELGRTLGMTLQLIVASGDQAAAFAEEDDPAAARQRLEAMVDGARATAADARRMVSRYQSVPPRAELASAAQLLTAAGIRTHVRLPTGIMLRALPEPLRAALRAGTARLLVQGGVDRCVIEVTRRDEKLVLELRPGRAESRAP